MKLLRQSGDGFEMEFAREEKGLLFHLLGMYPLVPAGHHKLTGTKRIRNQKENQELLDETIQSQRKANQEEIILLVSKPGRFTDLGETSRAVFQRDELEWLLQVLNDVRVGCWIMLGSPAAPDEATLHNDKKAFPNLVMMEIAGGFQMFFLSAISGTLKPGAEEA